MIVNGTRLLRACPIRSMFTSKHRFEGTSYGLSEAGYDIRIAEDVTFTPSSFWKTQSINVVHSERTIKETNILETLRHNNFALASAMEEFQMPKDLVGVVHDKSTWARKGLSLFNTVIEPGWNGFLTLELVFHGRQPVTIKRGQGIAQVLFSRLEEDGDYGDGKYQNQQAGPVEART